MTPGQQAVVNALRGGAKLYREVSHYGKPYTWMLLADGEEKFVNPRVFVALRDRDTIIPVETTYFNSPSTGRGVTHLYRLADLHLA